MACDFTHVGGSDWRCSTHGVTMRGEWDRPPSYCDDATDDEET